MRKAVPYSQDHRSTQLLPSFIRFGNDLSDPGVFLDRRQIHKRINLLMIRFAFCQTILIYMGFNDLPNDQGVTSEIEREDESQALCD